MTTYLFTPPTVEQGPVARDRLFFRYTMPRGLTVIKRFDATYYESRFPAQTELEAAADFWLGGHIYTIDQEARDELAAAGYGANITATILPGAYGTMPYGEGSYGGSST